MIRRSKVVFFWFLLLYPLISSGQISINALVADSASLKPIPFVTVRIHNSYRGNITNEQGYLAMDVSEKDTLIFSTVGYYPKKIPAVTLQNVSVIYLTQEVRILKEIEFTGVIQLPSWLPKLEPESPYRNKTKEFADTRTTGFRGFETFGPGFVTSFGKLKPSREEKKLGRIQKENTAAKGYVALVNDPEVKGRLMKDYNLTESQYFDHLANFNQKNKDFIYDLDDADVVHLIFTYFATNVKK